MQIEEAKLKIHNFIKRLENMLMIHTLEVITELKGITQLLDTPEEPKEGVKEEVIEKQEEITAPIVEEPQKMTKEELIRKYTEKYQKKPFG